MTSTIKLPKQNKTKRISNLLLEWPAKSIGTVAVRRLRLLDTGMSDFPGFFICVVVLGPRPGRCLKRYLEAVASFWPSLSPNGAMGTRFVAETVVLGLMTGDD